MEFTKIRRGLELPFSCAAFVAVYALELPLSESSTTSAAQISLPVLSGPKLSNSKTMLHSLTKMFHLQKPRLQKG